MTASAPQAIALEMSPPVRMPPSAITFTYWPVSSRCWVRAAEASAMAVACGTPTPRTPRVVQAAPGPTPDEHARRPGAHQVQRRLVGGAAADDHRHGQLGDELLQVERLDDGRDVLGRDDRALDHEHVEAGVERRLPVLAHALGRQRRRREHALGLDLGDAAGDQLGLDRLGVDLLHLAGRLGLVEGRDPLELLVGILVARPDALEVEHAQPAEAAEDDGRLGRDDAVHGRGQERQLEQVRAEPPGDVDVLGVARAPAGHDRDVVEPVCTAGLLAPPDLNLHA